MIHGAGLEFQPLTSWRLYNASEPQFFFNCNNNMMTTSQASPSSVASLPPSPSGKNQFCFLPTCVHKLAEWSFWVPCQHWLKAPAVVDAQSRARWEPWTSEPPHPPPTPFLSQIPQLQEPSLNLEVSSISLSEPLTRAEVLPANTALLCSQ